MQPLLVVIFYCSLVTATSLFGGWLPTRFRLTHNTMQYLMSYLGGLMMGVAFLHLLPHSISHLGAVDPAMMAATVGLIATLFLIRCFHFHQHDFSPAAAAECEHDHCHPHDHSHDHAHDHDHGHDHDHDPGRSLALELPVVTASEPTSSRYSWLGLFVGLAIHTLMDGVAIAASVAAEEHEPSVAAWAGLGTFLVVALHKPLDSMSITLMMTSRGWSRSKALSVNLLYAAICPIGAVLAYFGMTIFDAGQGVVIGWALGLSAGVFLCIALVDVLPETQFHSHDRLRLSATLLLGVATAFALGLFEPKHAHDLPHQPAHQHGHH